MSILAIATALRFLEERLNEGFLEKTKKEIDDIRESCEIIAIIILEKVFNNRTKEEYLMFTPLILGLSKKLYRRRVSHQ